MLAGAGAARDAAEANGEPYGTIFTTTSGYLNSKSGQYAYNKLYNVAARFTELLYDTKNQEDLYRVVKQNSKGGNQLMVLLEFNHRQLGYTDEWLREKIAMAISDGESYLADYLNIWIEGNAASPFPKEVIKVINDSVVHDPYTDISGPGFIIRWYVTEDVLMNDLPTRHMVCGHDASNAINSDDCTLVFMDVKTGETLGVGEYNDTNIVVFHNWIASLFLRFRNMVFVPENRSTATTLIDNLLLILPRHGIDPYARVFNWVVDEATEYPKRVEDAMLNYPVERRSEAAFRKYRKEFGYATSGGGKTSRANLYGESILSALKQLGNNIRDKKLVNQLSALKQRNGRIDHDAEGKDDLVIAWLLCYWFLTKARHKEMYGIRSNMALSVVINNELNRDGNREKVAKQNYQLELKTMIDELVERVKVENNPIKTDMLKSQILHLYKDIDIESLPTYNIEDILENIEMDKKKNRTFARTY